MPKTSLRGASKASGSRGYVLVEAIALLVVVGLGVTALVATASGLLRAVHRQSVVTAQIVKERNEQASAHME